ncbi:hypothetical protein Pla163_37350 [Planctomycetes bacterium Pla163]|uniref:Uncharacterized protein n=1 Tax=Rohdeia mirabilis TaxID=2528008 RepID=A0A518D549_9BACT|nr:hypothetical protein Pla163_37350 [Planctomycetes bacterium Pla163]
MPLSTDVTLPRDAAPLFPDRCIGCGTGAPGSTWRFARRASRWWSFFVTWIGELHVVEVPCCTPCRARLRRQRLIRGSSFVFATVAVLAVVLPALEGVDRVLQKPIALGLLLATLAPVLLYQVLYPPPFDTTVGKKYVDYEFADSDAARDFHALNEHLGAELES